MATSPPPPEFDVPLVATLDGKINVVWWEWLQSYIRWGQSNMSSGPGVPESPNDGNIYGRRGSDTTWQVTGTWASTTGKPTTFPPSSHTHTTSDVTGFAEAVDDRVAALIVAGDNITVTYDDSGGTLTIDSGGGGTGAVSAVTASAPVTSSGGATPNIAMAAATGSVDGYLSAANWTTFNAKAGLPIAQASVTNLVTDLAAKAALASPALTGSPTAPTPSAGDNDTSIATTAFVQATLNASLQGGLTTADWTYNTSASVPPSAGQVRTNSTTPASITTFHVHQTTAPGIETTNMLALVTAGVILLAQDKTDAAKYAYYEVTGDATDMGAYFDIPVAYSSGGSAFTAGGPIILAFFGINAGESLQTTPVSPTGSTVEQTLPNWLAKTPIVEITDDAVVSNDHKSVWLHMLNDIGSIILLPDTWQPGEAFGARQIGEGPVTFQIDGGATLQLPFTKADHTGISEQYEEVIFRVIANSDGSSAVWGINGGTA